MVFHRRGGWPGLHFLLLRYIAQRILCWHEALGEQLSTLKLQPGVSGSEITFRHLTPCPTKSFHKPSADLMGHWLGVWFIFSGFYSKPLASRTYWASLFVFDGIRCFWHYCVWRVQNIRILQSACNMLTIHFSPKDTAFGFCQSFTFLWRLPTEVPITRLVCHIDNCSLGINFLQQAPDFHFYSNNGNTQ